MDIYFTPEDLAHRWTVTLHTLEQWRWRGRGPHFFKAGRLIRYPRKEIERFEMNISPFSSGNAKDKCFSCIDLKPLMSKGTQEESKEISKGGKNIRKI
jgi:hypothetical protein